KAGSFSALDIAAIASIGLLHGQWLDFIEPFLSFMKDSSSTNLGVVTLHTIGYIC
ncbi:hypothetical protein EDC04DRAFT_2523231, partial [Pisolithus marmoratus]